MNRIYKAGAVQFNIVNGDINGNLDTAFFHLTKLADQGADIAVLPELFSCGFDNENIGIHARRTPETLEKMTKFARATSMALAGTLPQAEGNQVFNTLYFIDRDGDIKGAYQKLHLFRLTLEHQFYTQGNRACVIETSFGPVGLMVCYDLRFPELARQLFLDGARLFIVSAQWPTPRKTHWQTLIRARAIENQSYFICSNRTGTDGDLEFPGCSSIVDPLGEVVAEAGDDARGIMAKIDMEAVDRARELIPVKEDRRKDIYG